MNANALIGTHDVLFVVLDCLRYDVARDELAAGRTPNLGALIPQWEERHAPGTFTFASHQAFFAGFLPTPARPGRHPRLFATRFGGSETITPDTCVFEAPDIVHGLSQRGYRTICVGGVGFFNPANPLGKILPGFFDEAHWSPHLGVTDPESTRHQVALACARIDAVPKTKRAFVFVNVSALHQPNKHYLPGATSDSKESQAAALRYVDSQLPPLFAAMKARGPSLCIICSDHGEAYGDDGYFGHRFAHPSVWTVPYAHLVLE